MDIIVTARRREESLLETPVAVTAFNAQSLENSQITHLSEIQKNTPSLIYGSTGGTKSQARIFIRGVGNTVASDSFSAGVGLYVDGAYFPRAQGSLLDSLDISSVEVLRGPQGTLFGKNTIGGAINITTVKPNSDGFSGQAELGYGRFGRVRLRATLNIPLTDNLAIRLSGLSDRDDGYSVNDTNGQKLDNQDRRVISGALHYTPTENLTFDVSAFYTRDRSNGRAINCVVSGDSPFGPAFDAACAASAANGIRHTRSELLQLDPADMFATSARLAWNVGKVGVIDDLTFKAIGVYQSIDTSHLNQEFDGTDLVGLVGQNFGFKAAHYSGEFQVLGEALDRHLNFVLGVYADREYTPGKFEVRGATVFPFLEAFIPPLSYVQTLSQRAGSKAIYGQFTYDLNEIVSITGGIRHTRDRAGFYAQKYHVSADDPTQTRVGNYLTDGLFVKTFPATTPMGTLQLNAPSAWTNNGILDQAMLYFTYSNGFKGGGFNSSGEVVNGTLTRFKPEKVDNYEVGAKFALFDRRLTGSITRFQMDYKDIQFSVAGDASQGVVVSTFNAGAARVSGVEVELQALLMNSLHLSFNGDFNDAKYTRFDDASVPGGSRVGEPVVFIPKYHVSGSIDNRFDLGGDMALTPRIQVTRTGKTTILTTPDTAVRSLATVNPYTLVDASLRLDINENVSLDVYGKNIFNVRYKDDVQSIGFVTLEYYAPPVTWGANLRLKF
jgi:iron complex outermembrane receptor protein